MAEDNTLIGLSATAGPRRTRLAAPALDRGAAVGRYIVLELLGEGGMGVVYAAYDPDLDRRVALKLLRRSDAPTSRSARTRLLREARAMAKLHHPNVVTVYEVGTVGDEDFVAMQYVDGTNLSKWLERGARVPTVPQILDVFRQAARGLAAAHRSGMIHRDFKPANVLVDTEGRVRVTDFGLAQVLEDAVDDTGDGDVAGGELDELTRTGGAVGTPAYMAPEQFLGLAVDERTDQFGFCVSLYEALYGERPFEGETYEEVRESVVTGAVRDEPVGVDVPARVRKVLLRGLHTGPDDRYPSVEALLADLAKDPKIVRRVAVAGGALAVVGTIAAIAIPSGIGERASATELCPDPGEQLVGVWDAAVRARVERAFELSRVPSWPKAFEGFAVRMDDYARDWSTMYAGACEAFRVRGAETEDQFILRMGCLQERRADMASLANVFDDADATAVEQAVEAAEQGLRSLELCADVAALQTGYAAPTADQRDIVADLRSRLAEVKAFEEAGQHGRALESVAGIVRGARDAVYAPVLAEALVRQGSVHASLEHLSEARVAFEEAIVVAEEAQHEEARAMALVGMTMLSAVFSSNADDARMWGRRASAAIKRLGRDPEAIQGRLNLHLAHVLRQTGEHDEALALLEDTRRLYEIRLGPKHARIAKVLLRMGHVQAERGWFVEALELFREALFLAQELYGGDHRMVAAAYEGMGDCFRGTAQYDEAREYHARAATFWATERGQELLADRAAELVHSGSREVRGRVVGVDGRPVSGADVVIGKAIGSDGRYLYARHGVGYELEMGVQRTTSDVDGRFEFDGVPEDSVMVAAEDLRGGGRSRAVVLPKGRAAESVVVRLVPVGEVRGTVTFGGETRRGVFASAVPSPLRNNPTNGASAWLEADGSYVITRLPAGAYQLIIGSEREAAFVAAEARTFRIKGGQRTVLDVDINVGNVDLTVAVKSKGGGRIPTAQVILVEGVVRARTAAEFNKAVLKMFARGTVRSIFVTGEHPQVIENLRPAHYSACIVPLSGDHRDPDFARKLKPKLLDLAVHCQPLDVLPSPESQSLTATIPPAVPL